MLQNDDHVQSATVSPMEDKLQKVIKFMSPIESERADAWKKAFQAVYGISYDFHEGILFNSWKLRARGKPKSGRSTAWGSDGERERLPIIADAVPSIIVSGGR